MLSFTVIIKVDFSASVMYILLKRSEGEGFMMKHTAVFLHSGHEKIKIFYCIDLLEWNHFIIFNRLQPRKHGRVHILNTIDDSITGFKLFVNQQKV